MAGKSVKGRGWGGSRLAVMRRVSAYQTVCTGIPEVVNLDVFDNHMFSVCALVHAKLHICNDILGTRKRCSI